jgi:hypothetical protein
MAVVIDDRLLLDLLAGHQPEAIASELSSGGVFTTSSWYYRLGRATFDDSGAGALSGRLASFGQPTTQRVRAALVELPESIGLLHPRLVVPVMFTLRRRVHRQLNLLGAEALAVALLVPARLFLTTASPLLRAAAHDTGIDYQLTT